MRKAGKREDPCRGCGYLRGRGADASCGYFLATGRRRPCPAGEDCTVRLTDEAERAEVIAGAKKQWQNPQARQPKRAAKIDSDKALAMFAAGASDAEIAAQFGAAPVTVSRWRRRYGLLRG